MSKLSKRERVLLIILGAAAVIYVGVFLLIMPAMNALSESRLKYPDLVMQQREMQYKLSEKPVIEQTCAELENQFSVKQGEYFYAPENFYIDQYVTKLCFSHKLTPSMLTIGKREPIEVALPVNAEETAPPESADESAALSAVSSVEVVVQVSGEISDLKALCGEISGLKTIRVKSLDYTRAEAENGSTARIVFDMFVIDLQVSE